ncbi:unnamed protein product [Prorocentrum cordatum]|uniref:Altered inheritance of mitochondria protein 24, mitochondrial n=1 Tax=Prorocentrum cordatum TaxID=2364126 RepID=A0ABN9VY56_9DINO|nr:unnamed protein product [Polarella glacialis]
MVLSIAHFVLFANFALPLQAVTLQNAADEALLRRAGRGAAAGEAGNRNGMVTLQYLMDQHVASETELHLRAGETWRKYANQLADSGCSYRGGLLPCPNGNICYYTGHGGLNVTATVEYRGNIIKTVISPDPDAGIDMPDIVTFLGASTDDAPAMLMDVPAEYRRTANPVMLKMFFVEDTDDVTEQCPHDSERVESVGNGSVSYRLENNTITVSTQSPNTFMGMAFDFVSEAPVGHTLAFEIPVGAEIVWVSRAEMVEVLQSEELPASVERRLEEQLRKSALAKGMDDALTQKGSTRRRRRRSGCSAKQTGAMAGGAAAVAVGVLACVFTFIGCFTASPFLVTMGTRSVKNGACDCWAKDNHGKTACGVAR